MNNDTKRFFFDPLYKAVILQDSVSFRPRSALAASGATIGTKRLVPPLIDTFEFARLMHLRQAGLLYLVFPSATHTRFAHSLGCCHLGWAAMASIKIHDPDSEEKPQILEQWLEKREIKRGWQNEFLIALLCHDVGHFAFSHVIEDNEAIKSTLGFDLNHEDIGCDLILGKSNVLEAMSSLTRGLKNLIMLNNTLRASDIELNLNLICYLISGKESYLCEFDDRKKRQAKILHALTSGLLDLDRIDHYRRDSEFVGLQIGFNYQALLHGLTVVGDSLGGAINLRVEKSAVGHALSLLHLRERLSVDCFYHDINLSLGAMCNWAIARFLAIAKNRGANSITLLGYLFQGDDGLLQLLIDSNDPGVNSMASRLAANQPFALIGCYKLKQTKNINDINMLIKEIDGNYDNDPIVLYKAHPHIMKWPSNDEWLSLDHLLDKKDGQLSESGPYANQVGHFKTVGSTRIRNVWFFAADSDKIDELKDLIKTADLWDWER